MQEIREKKEGQERKKRQKRKKKKKKLTAELKRLFFWTLRAHIFRQSSQDLLKAERISMQQQQLLLLVYKRCVKIQENVYYRSMQAINLAEPFISSGCIGCAIKSSQHCYQ